MREIVIFYNSSGYLKVAHNDNASEERVLEVLKKAVRKQEKQIKGE